MPTWIQTWQEIKSSCFNIWNQNMLNYRSKRRSSKKWLSWQSTYCKRKESGKIWRFMGVLKCSELNMKFSYKFLWTFSYRRIYHLLLLFFNSPIRRGLNWGQEQDVQVCQAISSLIEDITIFDLDSIKIDQDGYTISRNVLCVLQLNQKLSH